MRVTIACPATMLEDANNLAMALAFGPDDAMTYREPTWQDASGNTYSAASLEASDEWVTAAQAGLSRPEWDGDYTVNMAGAKRAQDVLVFWVPSDDQPEPPLADPTKLTAIGGMEGLDALAAMGLTRIDAEVSG